jgi:hypothetical protein
VNTEIVRSFFLFFPEYNTNTSFLISQLSFLLLLTCPAIFSNKTATDFHAKKSGADSATFFVD